MMKKIVLFLVYIMLVTSIIFVFPVENGSSHNINKINENEINKNNYNLYLSWGAQSFTPNMSKLTKVKLSVAKHGLMTCPLIVSIREDLYANDTTSVSVDSSLTPYIDYNAPNENFSWVEFDFPDINVNINQKYFIVARCFCGNSSNSYLWGQNSPGSLYSRGEEWMCDWQSGWWEFTTNGGGDFGFETYNSSSLDQYFHWEVRPGLHARNLFYEIIENQPPIKPSITGDSSGKSGTEYEYTFVSTDPENNDIYYFIDWGDNTNSSWLGPFPSNYTETLGHIWNKKGIYTVKAEAIDTYGAESFWATLTISMTKSKTISTPLFLQRLFQRIPFFEKILNQ